MILPVSPFSFVKIISLFVLLSPLPIHASDDHYDAEQKLELLSSNESTLNNSNATSYSSDTDSEDSEHHTQPKHPLNLLGLLPEIWDTVGRYLTMREILDFSMTCKDFYKFYHTSPLKLELLDTALQVYTQEDQTPFFTDTVANKLKILMEITGQLEDMRNDYRDRNRPDLAALTDNLFATAKADVDPFLHHAARVRFSPTLKLTDGHKNLRYLAEFYTTELAFDSPFTNFFCSYFREKYYFSGAIATAGMAAVGSILFFQYFKFSPTFKYAMDVHEAFLNQTEMPRERFGRGSCFSIETMESSEYNKDKLSRLYSVIKYLKMDSKFWNQYFLNLLNSGKSFPYDTMPCFKNMDNQTLDCVATNGIGTLFFEKASAECAANTVLNERILAWKIYYTVYHISFAAVLFVYFIMPILSWLL